MVVSVSGVSVSGEARDDMSMLPRQVALKVI